MIWIDVTARAARQVRALAAEHAAPPATGAGPGPRFGLRITVDGEQADAAGPRMELSLSTRRGDDDVVLPRFGFDVVVHGPDAPEVDGVRIDFVSTGDGSGFVIDRIPRQRRPADPTSGSLTAPAFGSPPATAPVDEDLAERVGRALEEVRPTLRADGGDVELVSVSHGVAYLRLDGACSGCSAALLTLSAVIEKTVLARVPEVTRTVLVT